MKAFIKTTFVTITALTIILSAVFSIATPLTITHSSSMAPLAFINNDGKPDGVLIDLWNEWARQAGVEVVFKLQTWKAAVEDTANSNANINAGMFYSRQRAERMLYADYILHLKGGLFAIRDIHEKTILNGDESCGVIKGGYSKIFMEEQHPYTPLMLFNSAQEMFDAAAGGRLKIFVADHPVAVNQMNKLGISDSFKYVQDLYTRELYPTVSKNNPELIKKINLNMAAIPPKRKWAIIHKWLNPTTANQNHYKAISIITALVLILMSYLYRNEIKTALIAIKDKLSGPS
ncbi:ABC transporter substrate-binding protein [Marinifilum sp. JC120]|nr:ABC transporter substrate-binding protein [Marinifilum sp. JC120]